MLIEHKRDFVRKMIALFGAEDLPLDELRKIRFQLEAIYEDLVTDEL